MFLRQVIVNVTGSTIFNGTHKSCIVIVPAKGTHNTDSIMESKVIYYLEQCGFGV